MQTWWEGLGLTLQVLYCIAVPSTLILLLQMVLTMFGGHGDGGVDFSDTSGIDMADGVDFGDADFGGDADLDADAVMDGGNPADFNNLRLLTLQTVVTFLAVFGWVSIICLNAGMPKFGGILVGAVCGFLMMLLMAKMVQMSKKLVENGVLNLKGAIGETATVYVMIPPKENGTGKITMQLQGRFCELDAVNAGDSAIPAGTQVLVTDIIGDSLVVERQS